MTPHPHGALRPSSTPHASSGLDCVTILRAANRVTVTRVFK
jgi:hypothetical protein